jgi:hypothetical protein
MAVGADLASGAGKCCRDARHHLRRGSTSSTTGTIVLPTLLAEDRAASERELPDRNVPARPLPTASSPAFNDALYSALATARPPALSRCDSAERACWSLPKQAVFKVTGSIGDSTVRLWKERLYLSGCLAVSSVSCARAADTGPSPLYTREHRQNTSHPDRKGELNGGRAWLEEAAYLSSISRWAHSTARVAPRSPWGTRASLNPALAHRAV